MLPRLEPVEEVMDDGVPFREQIIHVRVEVHGCSVDICAPREHRR